MKNRSGLSGVASSPILVGAVTVLVVIVAVFLAYNANNGLPFVSTYNLKARVPNADALVKGNEVRIGGVRVGVVKKVVAVQIGDGKVAAELTLSLDKTAEPLPVDSTITVRPKSALGLKFLQVTPGDSEEGFEAGETIPVSSAKPEPVDIDEFFAMFDKPTRDAIRQNLSGFGNALAGRGPQLNEAFGALRRAAESGQPILRKIVEPSSNFAGFWRASRPSRRRLLRWPKPRRRCSAPSTRPSLPSLCLPPLYPRNDRKKPADPGRGQRRSACDSPLPLGLRPLLHCPAPGRQSLGRDLAGNRRIAPRRDPGPQRFAGSQQPAAADGRSPR